MIKYILKRLGLLFITLFIILSLSFILIKALPMYPPLDPNLDLDIYYAINAKYGYDKPIIIQYFMWVRNVFLDWDWGLSTVIEPNIGTFEILYRKLPVSMKVNIYSFLISMPIGVLFGVIAALRKNSILDQTIQVGVIFFISVPSFVLATLLMLYPAYHWGLFPIQFAPADAVFSVMMHSMILPILALSFGPIATVTRFTRAELTEVLTSDFLLLARTKGLSRPQCVRRHAFRNSMVPLVSIFVGNFVAILSGSLVIEKIFGIPGMGNLFLDSITLKDYNMAMTVLGFYTIISLSAILVVDLLYGVVDPRIRMGARR